MADRTADMRFELYLHDLGIADFGPAGGRRHAVAAMYQACLMHVGMYSEALFPLAVDGDWILWLNIHIEMETMPFAALSSRLEVKTAPNAQGLMRRATILEVGDGVLEAVKKGLKAFMARPEQERIEIVSAFCETVGHRGSAAHQHEYLQGAFRVFTDWEMRYRHPFVRIPRTTITVRLIERHDLQTPIWTVHVGFETPDGEVTHAGRFDVGKGIFIDHPADQNRKKLLIEAQGHGSELHRLIAQAFDH